MTTCLVVDDSDFDRKVLVQCAGSLGLQVTDAASANEALARCKAAMPDCMLIDWEMADTSGMELFEQLHSAEGDNAPYVIICTSHSHPSFIGHAYVRGVDGFITKPVTQDKLKTKLSEIGLL